MKKGKDENIFYIKSDQTIKYKGISSMPHYNTIFNQPFNFIPRHRFDKMVESLKMNKYSKEFTAWRQFLTVLYAQISGKDSLREIESGLLTHKNKLYHLG